MIGDIEFYNPNEIKSDCTFDFTTANEDNAALLFDNNVTVPLSSDGSSDGTNEKFKITFSSAKTINSVSVFGHNFKTGNVKYLDVSLVEQDFSTPIAWAANTTINNNVYSFNAVECYGIVANCTYTIAATQKSISEFRALNKFDTLPRAKKFDPVLSIEQSLKTKYDGGKDKIINGIKFVGTLSFDDLDNDNIDTLFSLAERGRPFYIYMSPSSAGKLKRFFRVQDQFLVNMTNEPKPKLPKDLIDGVTWSDKLKAEEV